MYYKPKLQSKPKPYFTARCGIVMPAYELELFHIHHVLELQFKNFVGHIHNAMAIFQSYFSSELSEHLVF